MPGPDPSHQDRPVQAVEPAPAQAGPDGSADRPSWVHQLAGAVVGLRPSGLQRLPGNPQDGRRSAVLMLFGQSLGTPDVLIIERAHTMRSHAGQPAFPGGRVEAGDRDAVDTALREANEETGLDPAGVDVVATGAALWVPPAGNVVTPVLAWWPRPSRVYVRDQAEVASVHRVPLPELVDPSNRLQIRVPSIDAGGSQATEPRRVGPAFRVRGLLVWGFTAAVLSAVLDGAGLSRAWDQDQVEELPADLLALAARDVKGSLSDLRPDDPRR